MSLIAMTADWHADGKTLEILRRQLAAMVSECNTRGVDLLCVAGDVFESSSIEDRHGSTGYIARGVIEELQKLQCRVLMIPGNHDAAGAGSADALHIFTERLTVGGCTVIHAPQWVICEDLDLDVLCVPWDWSGAPFPDPWRQDDAPFRSDNKTLLLAHVQIGGAVMNGGHTCPDEPSKFQISRADLEALPFDRFALGDFHKRQDLTDGRGGYIGALRQCNFGEEGNPAGFEIWDTEAGDFEWIELDEAPRHKTWIMAPGDAPPPECPPGWKYKVKLTGEQPDYVLVRDLERDGCVVEINLDMVQRLTRASVPPNVINDPRALMALWTESNDIGDERLARMLDVWDGLAGDENQTEGEARNESA